MTHDFSRQYHVVSSDIRKSPQNTCIGIPGLLAGYSIIFYGSFVQMRHPAQYFLINPAHDAMCVL